jgi:cobalt-zinc-cadmium efflux system protein
MSHGHSHGGGAHHHLDPDAGDRKVALAIAVNVGLTVVQVVGGMASGSLALIADGIHNLSDAGTLGIAWAARRIARRPADADMTFGYSRIEPVAALVNYTTLALISVWLAVEGITRLFNPQPVDGWPVVAIAALALAVDLATAALTWRLAKDSMNIRAAFLHNLADAMGSVAVIVAGAAVLIWGWTIVDPLVTLGIAGYILWMSLAESRQVVRLLMLGSPPGRDVSALVTRLDGLPGVAGLHHVHLWRMSEHAAAFDAHLTIAEGDWHRADAVKAAVKATLADEFGISHSTLEMECARHGCADRTLIGSGPHPAA